MNNFNNVSELEMAEAYADKDIYYGLVTSEEGLSVRFDELMNENPYLKERLSKDKEMLNEEFSNFANNLLKDGLLHSSQYNEYEYVGILTS